jgi:hypothetical protein
VHESFTTFFGPCGLRTSSQMSMVILEKFARKRTLANNFDWSYSGL